MPGIRPARRVALVLIPAVLVSVAIGSFSGNATQTETVGVGMPFPGKWAYNAAATLPYVDKCPDGKSTCPGLSSHPSIHHNPGGGDWATDLYAAAGTSVFLKLINPSGELSYAWQSSSTTCGQSARFIVRVDGVNVGSIYIAHLAGAVTSGTITNGMKLARKGCGAFLQSRQSHPCGIQEFDRC